MTADNAAANMATVSGHNEQPRVEGNNPHTQGAQIIPLLPPEVLLEKLQSVLPEITLEQMNVLHQHFEAHYCPRGTIMIEQFEYPSGLWFVLEGKVRLFQLTVVAKTLCALQLADHSADKEPFLIGETSLILNQLSNCTVIAAEDVTVLKLNMDHLKTLRQQQPELVLQLMDYAARVLAFRYANLHDRLESRIVAQAHSAMDALSLLKQYMGNVKTCTPAMAKKLFGLDDCMM